MYLSKRKRVLYWIFTLLVLLPTAGSAIPELFGRGANATVQTYQSLGYPLYLMKILATAKILGAVALLVNRSRRISEWAYAGFGILFLGAMASHLLAGDPAHAPIPLVFFALLAGSYLFWNARMARPHPARPN
jgi:DoxX-like family